MNEWMENIECEVPILFSCARGVGQLTGVALDQGAYDLPSADPLKLFSLKITPNLPTHTVTKNSDCKCAKSCHFLTENSIFSEEGDTMCLIGDQPI